MKEKVSKIQKSTFSNEWTNPSGGTTYYYDLVMENGESGSIGVTDKNSEKVKVGVELTYSILNGKFKVSMSNTQKPNTYSQGGGYAKKTNSQEQFLGYAWSYAKDLIIAGKTMKDVDELTKVARYIYAQIGEIMKESQQ